MSVKQDKEYFAVLGDLHGHITLAYRLLKRWEMENEKTLRAIFQVGDFGAYPSSLHADKATMRFYEKDNDELSFIDYYNGSSEAEEILEFDAPEHRKIEGNLYFIKGNHEDFEFLDNLQIFDEEYPPSVDAYYKIFYMPNGCVYEISIGKYKISVGNLGGVAQNNQCGANSLSKYYTKSQYRNLCNYNGKIDLFLSHDTPYNTIYDSAGSLEVLEFINLFHPTLHFCGHYHEDGKMIINSKKTQSFRLNEVNFRKSKKLNKGCIAIIEVSKEKHFQVSILDENWMKEYTKENFRKL